MLSVGAHPSQSHHDCAVCSVFANLFSVTEVNQWSDSNGVAVSTAAYDFVRAGLKCSDVLECKATEASDAATRTAELELATGECVCK